MILSHTFRFRTSLRCGSWGSSSGSGWCLFRCLLSFLFESINSGFNWIGCGFDPGLRDDNVFFDWAGLSHDNVFLARLFNDSSDLLSTLGRDLFDSHVDRGLVTLARAHSDSFLISLYRGLVTFFGA